MNQAQWLEKRSRIARASLACSLIAGARYLYTFGLIKNTPFYIDTLLTAIISACFSFVGIMFLFDWGRRELRELSLLQESSSLDNTDESDYDLMTDEISWYFVMAPLFLFSLSPVLKVKIDSQLAMGFYFLLGPIWALFFWGAQRNTGAIRQLSRFGLGLVVGWVIYHIFRYS
jgi:hypothetical protein